MNKISVIGIGYKPLEKKARETVLNSDIIVASKRLLEVFSHYDEHEKVKDRVRVINNVDETIAFIHSSLAAGPSSLVLLASGDPLFFGIGRRAIAEFGKDAVEIYPELSSLQTAFARIGEPWDDALLMSLHGGPDPGKRRRLRYELGDIPSLLERHNKIAILTDRENNPAAIAQFLHSAFASPLKLYVCERLGYPDEKITEGTPEVIAGMNFGEPNVVILKNEQPLSMSFQLVGNLSSLHEESGKDCGQAAMTEGGHKTNVAVNSVIKFGLRENEISHVQGLITKDEIRAVTVHKLRIPERGVFWDVGAGSGSVSIEVSRLSAGIKVYAIEKDRERIRNIRDNADKFHAAIMEIVEGMAPDALKGLPAPDRVFIGGSSGRLKETIGMISDAMPS
ncbi:MAG: precorrin-6y C5,15-methyltransferase (decarboxylating) subunit CbiE, partial [Nitrospirota bacterium]|nr:precorrin-6y C5,15-methyltransferase (decarboxylating) subunit CbiE [Nitrospirota bacterium]